MPRPHTLGLSVSAARKRCGNVDHYFAGTCQTIPPRVGFSVVPYPDLDKTFRGRVNHTGHARSLL